MLTYTELRNGFELGPWQVLPDRGLLRDGENEEHLEPKVMDVLVVLAAHQGDVVSKDQLIETVWEGRAQSDEPLNRCISVLRGKLGDDSRNPTYVENIPRKGYRLKMPVTLPGPPETEDEPASSSWPYWGTWIAGAAAIVLILVIVRGWPTGPGRTADMPMTSVAVFPFDCPGDTEKYLCFGFSEELTSTLLQAEGIDVVKSRNPFPRDTTPEEVAQTMGVDGIVTGSVQQLGGKVKIAAELVDGRNGFVVLSDTLDGSVEDIFRLQEQVAATISRLSGSETGSPLRAASEPSSFEAFEAYARGQYQFELRNRAAIEEAIDLFEETIRLDPLFGPAYLRLAYAYLLLPDYDSTVSADAMYELAIAKTNAGIAADPGIDAPAGTVFGFIHHKRGEWFEATEAYEKAVSAETVYPISHHWYSRLLATVGRLDESLDHARRAYELDPDSPIIISRLAIANFWVGNMKDAERYFQMVGKMTLDAPIHDLAYALFLIRSGDVDAARSFTKSGLEKNDLNSDWVDPAFDGIKNPAERQRSHDLVGQLAESDMLPRYIIMTLWVLLGDADRAIASALMIEDFGRAFELEVLFIDEFRVLREHADFQTLLARTGLQEYWQSVGCAWNGDKVECR